MNKVSSFMLSKMFGAPLISFRNELPYVFQLGNDMVEDSECENLAAGALTESSLTSYEGEEK